MNFKTKRPSAAQRRWGDPIVEDWIDGVASRIGDPQLRWLFENCFPNTLDTTVTVSKEPSGRDDTFVITGDIDAMWLRDSTAQVWPYLALLAENESLQKLIAGVINRQVACVRIDPYANAFLPAAGISSEWQTDQTEMRPGVHERKYELDSLCSVIRLSVGYFRSCGDSSCFDEDWRQAMTLILRTIRIEQAGSDEEARSSYRFARQAARGTDTQPLAEGQCYPHRRCGMSRSPFRPSDDACVFAYPVAANAMAVVCLRDLAEIWTQLGFDPAIAREARDLATEIDTGIHRFGVHEHSVHGRIYAYEIDGLGSRIFMDDANTPSLLSLPYLGYCDRNDPLYLRTRSYVLSPDNPFYAEGQVGRGVGGPHVGVGWIWPMSIIMRALTSDDDGEISGCLHQLKASHAGTGFMHESFWKDDASRFTRSWFAWANALFGELIVALSRERPHLLQEG